MNRAVFLDRDGVINVKLPDGHYVKKWADFSFMPKATKAIKMLNTMNFLVIIVTNQRGIARGLMTQDDLKQIHQNMLNELKAQECAKIDAIYVCPHEKEQCNCRKPKIGLFEKAYKDFDGIDKRNSWMVGDSATDIEAGNRFGVRTILVNKNKVISPSPFYTCKSLFEAAIYIKKQEKYQNLKII